jgi:hypothetical protein
LAISIDILSVELFDHFEHFRRVAAGIHAIQGMAHDALLVDDEGGAQDAHLLHAVDVL